MVTEPGCTKCVRDEARRVANQDRALQGKRRRLRQAPGLGFVGRSGQAQLHIIDGAIEQWVCTARFLQFGDEGICRTPITLECAQNVQADHIAGAFPDGVERRLAIDARHHALFDISGAAVRLHGLVGQVHHAFVDPVLADRRGDAGECRLALVGTLVKALCNAEGEGGGGSDSIAISARTLRMSG